MNATPNSTVQPLRTQAVRWARLLVIAGSLLLGATGFTGCTGSNDDRGRASDSTSGATATQPSRASGSEEETLPTPSIFIRFVADGEDEGRLETAITRYVNDDGVEAILYSAVHIADASYYDALEEDFETCDALLYELIAAEGTRPDRDREAGGIISGFQRALKRGLELEFQLEGIDYHAKNFVHADLSPRQFQNAQATRGESILGMMVDMYIEELKRTFQGDGSQVNLMTLIAAAQQPDAARQMKLVLGREMPRIERLTAGADPDGDGTAILTDRNIRCMEVFDEQLADGKKRIGIFYGGAHMPDLEERLLDRGFRKVGERYVSAWDMSKPSD